MRCVVHDMMGRWEAMEEGWFATLSSSKDLVSLTRARLRVLRSGSDRQLASRWNLSVTAESSSAKEAIRVRRDFESWNWNWFFTESRFLFPRVFFNGLLSDRADVWVLPGAGRERRSAACVCRQC